MALKGQRRSPKFTDMDPLFFCPPAESLRKEKCTTAKRSGDGRPLHATHGQIVHLDPAIRPTALQVCVPAPLGATKIVTEGTSWKDGRIRGAAISLAG